MKKSLFYFFALFVPFFLFELASCQNCDSTYTYTAPVQIDDQLEVASLGEVGIDTNLIEKGIRKIQCGSFNAVHSVLIYKNGKLVLEEYFPGYKYQWDAPDYKGELVQWNKEMIHPNMSVTKSYISALIGIAIEKGFISQVEEPIFNYLSEYDEYRKDGKEKITIEHLLTMSSGLAWNEWGAAHGTSANDIDRLYFDCSDNPIPCVLERPLVHEPGTFFTYNGGGTVMLGKIIENASGMQLDSFANEYLFHPLGIDTVAWFRYNDGTFAADGSSYCKPRDMVKIGRLFLQNGTWNGESILPQNWVTKSFTAYRNNKDIKIPIEDSGKNDYGYSWWLTKHKHQGKFISFARANGWGGQTIFVSPELETVIVFTSGNYAYNSKLFKIANKYLLPAIQ
ncbi:MAG: serine hydrolase [Saprospiraceae bacterium]|nr:serine hydrolase [Saprospiraceae bacterium]